MLRSTKNNFCSLILPLILLAYAGCQKPKHIDAEILTDDLTASVTEVSMKDTLPAKYVQVLNLEKISGLQFDYGDRHLKKYFEYHADKFKVLRALAQLGFSKNSTLADTKCRAVDHAQFLEMRNLTREEERNQADFFWGIDPASYDIYECLKTPSTHIVLIEKTSNRILHLILS